MLYNYLVLNRNEFQKGLIFYYLLTLIGPSKESSNVFSNNVIYITDFVDFYL